ncbi:IctB family putative bicarbonate transporter [Geitlerinema sp. PCC 9228]|uniref:IctB family putative bicarbonate transporter n=1 Tax=Geitlerinema sp. PCC 9228 TaxID=111611 RepID=UPI0008F9C07F|nr:IctB family putative bicarbonate transporter [Geitlerinema sp. PCC 9228]
MVRSVWQPLTLSQIPCQQWQRQSIVFRLTNGPLAAWRQGSWLMQWAEPLGALLVSLVFVVGPLVSTSLIGILLLACAGFWAILTVTEDWRHPQAILTPIHLLVLLYWAISTVAMALSPVREAAFTGWVELTLYLLLFALAAKLLRSHIGRRVQDAFVGVYLHISLMVSAYGIRQWYFGADPLATWTDPESTAAEITRVYSVLGNPNLLAGYLIPAVALSMGAIFAWRRLTCKALAVGMFVVNSVCLILTYSRGGWIGFLAAGFVFVLMLVYWWTPKLPQKWRIFAIPGVLGASAAVVVLAVLFVDPIRDRAMSIFAGREDSSNNFRMNVWAAVVEMIRDRPILGIGPGNDAFNQVYPLYMRPNYSALSAYSVFLEVAVETGFIGLASFLWFLLVSFAGGWRQVCALRDNRNSQGYWLMAALAAMVGLMVHGLVDTVWYRPQINTVWWLCVAIAASYLPIRAMEDGKVET